ncbi:hypothetical protein LIER_06757 [Lithospermum erythrorhizon]|uniref:LRAT domain-containing protein n=1 Tax=Lithospermum erythrorhizon TaxID=34254 RepID=A0AAV3P601_LITER
MGALGDSEIKQNEENVNIIEEKERIVKLNLFSNKIKKQDLCKGDHIYSWRHAYIYSHHGIYIGDGKVIHYTRGGGQEIGTGTFLDRMICSSSPARPSDSPCPHCGDQSKADGVICSCLDCFLSGGELYLFQYGVPPAFFIAKARGGTCTLAPSDLTDHVLHRAQFLLENGFGVYNLFKNNCEDFAIYCKTGLLVFTNVGVGRSGQACSFFAVASAVGSSPLRFLTSFAGLSAVTTFGALSTVSCGVYCISRFVSDIGVRRDVEKIPVERLVGRSSDKSGEITVEQETKLIKED